MIGHDRLACVYVCGVGSVSEFKPVHCLPLQRRITTGFGGFGDKEVPMTYLTGLELSR